MKSGIGCEFEVQGLELMIVRDIRTPEGIGREFNLGC